MMVILAEDIAFVLVTPTFDKKRGVGQITMGENHRTQDKSGLHLSFDEILGSDRQATTCIFKNRFLRASWTRLGAMDVNIVSGVETISVGDEFNRICQVSLALDRVKELSEQLKCKAMICNLVTEPGLLEATWFVEKATIHVIVGAWGDSEDDIHESHAIIEGCGGNVNWCYSDGSDENAWPHNITMYKGTVPTAASADEFMRRMNELKKVRVARCN